MSIPSGTTDFPLGHNFAITVGGRSFLLDAIDLPEKTTRVINRTNQNGDASDFQVRQAGEKITGTATLQRLDTNTAPPKSGDSILWTTAESAESDYMIGYVTDVKVSRSKDSADVFEIGFLAEDFLEPNLGYTKGIWQASSNVASFTANGDDGFTLGTGSVQSYAGLELGDNLETGTNFWVSFNADLDVGSVTASPHLTKREDISGLSDGNRNITQGLNTWEIQGSSSYDFKWLVFSDNTDGSSFTISDFRIARSQNGFTGTKLVRLRNVAGLSDTEFYFVQGDLNGFAQTLDTTSGNGLIGIDSNYLTIGRVKYDLGASAGASKTIQFKIAYPTTKVIGGSHDFTRFSNVSILSTEVVNGKKHSIIQGDANITSANSINIGFDFVNA